MCGKPFYGAFPISAKIDFQIEDRASRAEDKTTSGDLSSKDKTRVTVGVNAAIALLNSVSASADANSSIRLKAITDELNRYLGTLPADSTVGVSVKNDDDESRIDIRTVDGKIRVEVKEGEIKIKTDDNSGKSEYSNKDDDDDDKYESRDDDNSKDRDDDEDEDDDDDSPKRNPPVVVTPPSTTLGSYTLAEVATHNTSASCWTVVSGNVYNVTSWISAHPGGSSAIKGMCGVDASSAFNGQHGGQSRPVSELAGFKIGTLK
jgi:cytochrome b involved in lipid metabolism